jgi:signal transduction histidine kinase
MLEKSTIENITTATRERAERESVVFDLARKNHELLRDEVLRQLARGTDPRKVSRFDALLTRYPDGTIRNRKEIYDGKVNAGVFIPPHHPITPAFKSFIVTLMEVTEVYGKTFRANFQDTYFTTPENVMVILWPEAPNWTMEMAADFDMTKEEYVWVADAKHNPGRKTVWTGLFYDKVGATWMSSGETPIYQGDRHLATVGHDVMLSELTNRIATMNKGDGSYSLILRPDGRLVAHAQKQSELQTSEGEYHVSSDPFLKSLLDRLLVQGESTRHPETNDILVQAKIRGPDWMLVTVYPEKLILASAAQAVGFVMGLALLSLVAEMFFLYLVLDKEINKPLHELEAAADALKENRPTALNFTDRTDELGKFAATFKSMSAAITERDRALQEYATSLESKVRERTRELEEQKVISIQQAKMASLGEMAGGVAHEINNPLATASLLTHHIQDLIDEPEVDRAQIKANLEKVTRTIDRIAKIVRGLRTFSRAANKDPMQTTSLQAILRETISLCGEKMRNHGIDLRVTEGEEIFVSCRATEISQVILNLLNNSFDAIEGLGEKWIDIRLEKSGGRVRVRVTDSGHGIPPEIMGKLMQPFFTTKEVGKGTGLGLSIAKGIAEAHQGSLYVDTAEAHTCFVLELPVA